MHHRVDLLGAQVGVEFVQAHIAGERVEHLAGIGDVGDQGAGLRIVQRLGVEVQHLVAAIEQDLQRMLARLAAAAGEDDALHIVPSSNRIPAGGNSIAGGAAPWKHCRGLEGFCLSHETLPRNTQAARKRPMDMSVA